MELTAKQRKRSKLLKLANYIWTTAATIISLWLAFFPPSKEAKLTFYQKSQVDVFNVNNKVSGLNISLNGKELNKNNLDVKIIKLKLMNNGNADVIPEKYLKALPLGLFVKNGSIAQIKIAESHGACKNQNLINSYSSDSSRVKFNELYFGQNDYVVFDVWIVHQNTVEPKIYNIGKIADTPIHFSRSPNESTYPKEDILALLFVLAFFSVFIFVVILLDRGFSLLRAVIRKLNLRRKYGFDFDKNNLSQKLIISYRSKLNRNEFVHYIGVLGTNESFQSIYKELNKYEEIIKDFLEFRVNNSYLFDSSKKVLKKENEEILDKSNSLFWEFVQDLIKYKLAIINEDNQVLLSNEFLAQVELIHKK